MERRIRRLRVELCIRCLLKLLLTLRTTTEDTLRDRIVALDAEITILDQTISTKVSELNALIYSFYHLTSEEIAMVEGG